MAKDIAAARGNLIVVKDGRGNIFISELGDPVTDSLSKADKDALVAGFNAYRRSAAGKASSGEAIFVDGSSGAWRILQQGGKKVAPSSEGDKEPADSDDDKKKKKKKKKKKPKKKS